MKKSTALILFAVILIVIVLAIVLTVRFWTTPRGADIQSTGNVSESVSVRI